LSAYKNNFKLGDWNAEQDMLHLDVVERIHDLAVKGRIMSGSEWTDLEGSLEKNQAEVDKLDGMEVWDATSRKRCCGIYG